MGAVDEQVRRAGVGRGVEPLHRVAEVGAVRQPAVGLDGEGDRDRQADVGGGAHDPDRLGDGGQGVRRREVRPRLREGGELRRGGSRRSGRRRGRRPGSRRRAARPPRPRARRRPRPTPPRPAPRRCSTASRLTRAQRVGVVAEPGAPVGVGPPGRRLEEQAGAGPGRHVGVRAVVVGQHLPAVRVVEQREGREVRQVEPAVEDQVGLEPSVGDPPAGRLRQLPRRRHACLPNVLGPDGPVSRARQAGNSSATFLSRVTYAGQSTVGQVGDVHLEAGGAVDVLTQDVGVAGVPGEVGDDVDEHAVERDVAVRRRPPRHHPGGVERELGHRGVAERPHGPVEGDDLRRRDRAGTHQSACGSAS